VPKSKVRKKTVYTPPPDVLPSAATREKRRGPSPAWYPILMITVMLLGLAYIVVNYLAPDLPIFSDLGNWNFAVGFGLMVAGLILAVRWR
jgi:hypothetical protein